MIVNELKVKPCPFCGGKSAVHKYFSKYYAKCKKCGAYSAPYDTPEEAAAAWNTRVKAGDYWREKMAQVYVCDRKANTECNKSYCVDNGGECECTLDVNFALKNQDGEPIVYALKEGE